MNIPNKSRQRMRKANMNGEDFNGISISSIQGLRFAACLRKKIREFYGGHIPSTTIIAKDFSFRSGQKPAVSSETVRKWLSGISLPHMTRLSVLAEWLGSDLLDALNHQQNSSQKVITTPHNHSELPECSSLDSSSIEQKLQLHLNKLDGDEMGLVIGFIELLLAKKQETK